MQFHDAHLLWDLFTISQETILALIICIFTGAQLGVVFGPMRIDKSIYSFAGGMFIWSLLALITPYDEYTFMSSKATWSVGEVVFFLWFAMSLVEWLDHHGVFGVFSKIIQTTSIDKLVVIVIWMSFIISAILDNVTAAIVMGSLTKKLIASEENQRYFAGIVVLAANIGGVASPVGNTTSIQLWAGHQLTAGVMITNLLIPSLVAMAIVNTYFNARLSGRVYRPDLTQFSTDPDAIKLSGREQLMVLIFGVSCLLIGIAGKVVLHQLPWMGMGTGFSIFAIGIGIWHYFRGDTYRHQFAMKGAMKHVDTQTLFFFVGVLLMTAGLGHVGVWAVASHWLDSSVGTVAGAPGIAVVIGFASGVVSNSAIVASVQEAYPIVGEAIVYPANDLFWQMVAFTSGAGGNLTLFGSAAGIAMMAVVPALSIGWYFRYMTLPALLAFGGGTGTFFLQEMLFASLT